MQKESINEAAAMAHIATFGNTPVFSFAFCAFAIEINTFLNVETSGNHAHNSPFECLEYAYGSDVSN